MNLIISFFYSFDLSKKTFTHYRLRPCKDKTSIFNQGAQIVRGNIVKKSRGSGGTHNKVQISHM